MKTKPVKPFKAWAVMIDGVLHDVYRSKSNAVAVVLARKYYDGSRAYKIIKGTFVPDKDKK